MIALNSPIKPNLKKLQRYLEQVNDSGWYTNFGPLHNELANRLEDYLGVKNLLLTNNGTSALQIAGQVLGTQSVLTTPFSFIATTSAFMWQKVDVSFCDIDLQSYNLSPDSVNDAFAKGCKADTIVATHVYGNPCDVDVFEKLGKEQSKKVIYDAAHSFGVKVGDTSVLNYGDASTLSFHATKVFHTVEGGGVVFKEKSHFELAKELINFGINSEQNINSVGINAKLNEYQAAVGLVNLEIIDDVLEHRSHLFHLYREQLKDLVEVPKWHPDANANGAYMPIKLDSPQQMTRIVNALHKHNIQCRHYFSPPLNHAFQEGKSFGCSNSEAISEGILCLPLHAHLSAEDVNSVIKALKT